MKGNIINITVGGEEVRLRNKKAFRIMVGTSDVTSFNLLSYYEK